MNPDGFDDILFRGIPANANRRSPRFLTSACIHLGGLGLVLAIVPRMVMPSQAVRFSTTLIAPVEVKTQPKPVQAAVAIPKAPTPPPVLRPLPRIREARVTVPKLEDAPRLPNTPHPPMVLPTPVAAVHPPVQTGVFGSNAPSQVSPQLAVPVSQDAGFDRVAAEGPVARPTTIASAGFDTRWTDSRPAAAAAKIQTGAFGQASPEARSARVIAANVNHPGFDVVAGAEKPAIPDQIRKTGFDQPKAVNLPTKQAPPAMASVRPIEILDKPKPAYTPEARTQKIEGDVLLDVVFAASGEVRVLGVVRGLGHGLDESAIDAARRIRFTPALQSGRPVDQHVTLHVVFQITG